MRQNKKFVTDEETEETKKTVYDVVEMYLDGHDWIVGDTMTIADFHYISTIASIVVSLKEFYYFARVLHLK